MDYKKLYEEVLKDNEILAKENEQLRRENYGLKHTLENYRRKEARMYERYTGEVKDA